MHIHTIAAFAFLFWRMEAPSQWQLLTPHQTGFAALMACGLPALLAIFTLISTRKIRRMMKRGLNEPGPAARFHHRSSSLLRFALIAGFGVITLFTPWPDWFSLRRVAPALQVFADLVVLLPYFVGAILMWIIAYPIDRMLHGADDSVDYPGEPQVRWRLSSYLDFQIRHHLLVIAGPMVLILFAANITHAYENSLREWGGSVWTPDILLGFAAATVFLTAPFMLRRLWRTMPLDPGPLREKLTELCGRVGLRCREILVWKSDGLMINAAVMGIIPGTRYVLLSDALLASMTPRQVEAVFGHEAGHVRHRHMQHFLAFAFVGWLVAGAATEVFSWWFNHTGRMTSDALALIQGIGLLITFVIWIVGFGWLSRRFERQADLFGARCVTPSAADCQLPCSVHLGGAERGLESDRVCATGAAVFASALGKVAAMSGISHEEPSWRHASVGTRIRFLQSAAGDPNRALNFERLVRRVKATLVTLAVVGGVSAAWYWTIVRPIPFRPREIQGVRQLANYDAKTELRP
jgi:STE24 endopeptidase